MLMLINLIIVLVIAMLTWRKYILLFWLFSSSLVSASSDYQQWIDEIHQRLDKTTLLYQQQSYDKARTEVQMAYFELFENLEGPIRINISAQKSYQMEAMFAEIRRLAGVSGSQAEVEAKIHALKKELTAVLPVLTVGHRLKAEQQHSVYENATIVARWQQSFKIMDDLLAQAVSEYQDKHYDKASQLIQQAHWQGFKNSGMEISVRLNRSAQQAAEINQQLSALALFMRQPDQMNTVAWKVTELLQQIEDILPHLPDIQIQESLQQQTNIPDVALPSADWGKTADDINRAVADAIAQYRQGQVMPAMLAIQNAYFDQFEASGMESKTGSRDADFKSVLEGRFTRLVSLIKAGSAVDQLNVEADKLKQDLENAVRMLTNGDETSWNLFLYSLLIIVREGLEALLIVAAIIAYLVKNQHQDKLPLIRQSVIVALFASIVTAVIFSWLFAGAGQSKELLEGITMLLAVIILFSVSYWLLSKVESQRWKAWLQGKFADSLGSGSVIGLWLASFLAVYREGAETVLFYFALAGDVSNASGHLSILAGFVTGCLILLMAYLVMRFTVIRLPLKPFFIVTSGFMYLMAFVFAGKGMLELIEGKLFEPTLLPGIPQMSALGIYPYLETLVPQLMLLLAALFALWMMHWRSGRIRA